MKKQYIYVLLTYITMQFSSFIGMPAFALIAATMGFSSSDAKLYATAYWGMFSFVAALVIIIVLLRKELTFSGAPLRSDIPKASIGIATIWVFAGIFMAFISQSIAIELETLIGIEAGSKNTQFLVSLISSVPIFIIITSIIGPILEEIVFRKIIFGTLYKRWNFFISALLSSLIFGLAHFEFTHLILYTAMGFTFALLYAKTQRILVPIVAHVMMNTLVVIAQLVFKDEIEKMLNEMDQVQSFIGGLL